MRPFLYHIRPRFYGPEISAKLVELHVDALGVHLLGKELRTGHPYPNKNYDVGCRRIGRKHIDGFLLSLSDWPPDFEVRAHWAIAEELAVVKHKVRYKLIDKKFAAASDDMTLWYAAGNFGDRYLWAKETPRIEAEPCMRTRTKGKWLANKTEMFELPTIEPERILGPDYPRSFPTPTLDMAIKL
jgi:Family of unknown function (DUF6012)